MIACRQGPRHKYAEPAGKEGRQQSAVSLQHPGDRQGAGKQGRLTDRSARCSARLRWQHRPVMPGNDALRQERCETTRLGWTRVITALTPSGDGDPRASRGQALPRGIVASTTCPR
jgi:hypothetical protein